MYDDGDVEDLRLEKERWELIENVMLCSFCLQLVKKRSPSFLSTLASYYMFAIFMMMNIFFLLYQDYQSTPSSSIHEL